MIQYFSEDIDFSLPDATLTSEWLLRIIHANHRAVAEINYIFCSDSYLLALNQQHLDHHDYTDILTFPYHDDSNAAPFFADIYISLDRVKDNAAKFHDTFERELRRVMVHGVFHLLGYNDQEEEEKTRMRKLEQEALILWER